MENNNKGDMVAFLIPRVSDKKQESNDAQLRRIKEFAESKGFKKFIERPIEESSTKVDRKKFQAIINEVIKSKGTVALFVDTIDRLQRSFRESVMLDDMRKEGKVELHFYRENLVIHKDSNSADLIRWDMGVMFARSYVLQLSDNVKRRFEQMRLDGIKTGSAPLGYKNVQLKNEDGKVIEKNIIPDPQKAPLVIEAFKLFATGEYSVKTMTAYMKKKKLRGNKKGKIIAESMMHKILADPFYYGEMRCKGQLYPHKYKPLISKSLYDTVQDILHGRCKNKVQMTAKEFIFGKGLLTCKRCGCSYSGEEKKGKFIYYACTNSKNKCKRIYVPERELIEPIREVLAKLQLSDEKVEEVLKGLKKSTEYKSLFQKNEMARLRSKYDSLTDKMNRFLDLFGEGGLTKDAYDKKIAECVQEQKEIESELEGHTEANEDYLVTAGRILDLSKRALDIFDNPNSEPGEKRQLLSYLIQNPTMDGKKLMFTLRNPFNKVVLLNEHPIKLRR